MIENQNVNTEGLIRGVSYDTEPEKTYLILIDGEEVDEQVKPFRDWQIVEGRQAAYDYIKNIIKTEYVIIDIHKSKIIVDSDKVKISDGISIYDFMKAMKDGEKVIDYTSFDIEDYNNYDPGDIEGAE